MFKQMKQKELIKEVEKKGFILIRNAEHKVFKKEESEYHLYGPYATIRDAEIAKTNINNSELYIYKEWNHVSLKE